MIVFFPSLDSFVIKAKWFAGTSKIVFSQQQGMQQVTRLQQGVEFPSTIKSFSYNRLKSLES